MVAPCYHLACGIFEDAGFKGRLKAVTEDDDGIDLTELSRKLQEHEEEDKAELQGTDVSSAQASKLAPPTTGITDNFGCSLSKTQDRSESIIDMSST